jgi:hypothetical protein
MGIKNYVGLLLFIAVFIFGNIIYLGISGSQGFSLVYFIFCMILFLSVVFMSGQFSDKRDLSLALVLSLILALSMVFLVQNLKIYNDDYQRIHVNDTILQSQLNNISNYNKYYQSISESLVSEISAAQENTNSLQNQINEALIVQNSQNKQLRPSNQVQIIEPTLPNYEDGGERDD